VVPYVTVLIDSHSTVNLTRLMRVSSAMTKLEPCFLREDEFTLVVRRVPLVS
jgi:hypothetical protein